jgi:2-phosphoglycerate kinase
VKAILIGGTSHVGKTTVAKRLAERLGWRLLSTDYIARHPGRPWRTDGTDVPEHVIRHFTDLSVEELVADVRRHYQSVWPQTLAEIEAHNGSIIEGSAVLPQLAAQVTPDHAHAFLLTLDADTIGSRIQSASSTDPKAILNAEAISKFTQRAIRFNELVSEEARALGLPILQADADAPTVAEQILAQLDQSKMKPFGEESE